MRGLDVTLVERGDASTPALASPVLSEQVADLYREHGVELLLGEQIEEFRANGRMLTGARTGSGRVIEAFLAVVGVGVEPDVEFLEGTGSSRHGVVVDDHFRTSVDDIYAIGDVAASTTSSPDGRGGSSTGAAGANKAGQLPRPPSCRRPRPATPRWQRSSRSSSISSCRCWATRTEVWTRS